MVGNRERVGNLLEGKASITKGKTVRPCMFLLKA